MQRRQRQASTHEDNLRPIRTQWNPLPFSYYHDQPQCCGGPAGGRWPPGILELHTHLAQDSEQKEEETWGIWSCHKPDTPVAKQPPNRNVQKSSLLPPGFHIGLSGPYRITEAGELWEMAFQLS